MGERFVGGVAESNAPVAPGEVPESRLAAPDEGTRIPLRECAQRAAGGRFPWDVYP